MPVPGKVTLIPSGAFQESSMMTADSIVTVGDGRGFVVGNDDKRWVITAAHCLPSMPPAASIAGADERTYFGLVGRLGAATVPGVTVECLFVNPVADLAILGQPDNQSLSDHADAYDDLLASITPLRIGNASDGMAAEVVSLDLARFRCRVEAWGQNLALVGCAVEGGMSGSPIVNGEGEAVGVVVTGSLRSDDFHGPQPSLTENLPAWFLRETGFTGIKTSRPA